MEIAEYALVIKIKKGSNNYLSTKARLFSSLGKNNRLSTTLELSKAKLFKLSKDKELDKIQGILDKKKVRYETNVIQLLPF